MEYLVPQKANSRQIDEKIAIGALEFGGTTVLGVNVENKIENAIQLYPIPVKDTLTMT